jgi:hypothetical protein
VERLPADVVAETRVRPLSSNTTWSSWGPSPSVTPVQSDVYGFMPLARRRPRQELQEDLEVGERRHELLDPSTVTSTGGSVVHMRPLPSDSTTQIVPVSATPKFAPLTPTFASRNRSRR